LNQERVRPVPICQKADGLPEQDASGVSVELLTEVHSIEVQWSPVHDLPAFQMTD